MKTKKSNKKNILTFTALSAVLLAGSIGVGFLYYSTRTNTQPEGTQGINYNPPTNDEINSSQDGKKNSAEQDPTSPNKPNSTKKTVAVGISYSDIYGENLEIRAFTNGVIEGNGICTATVKNNGFVITKTSEAFIDASSSQCNPIYIPSSELEPGTWVVTVKFSSSDAEGTSDSVEVKIQ